MSGAPGPATAAILESVADYYSEKLRLFGATARGVDWNSAESQSLRFRYLLKAIDEYGEGSVTDFGCGYGALLDYLDAYGRHVTYQGFDVSPSMVDAARQRHRHRTDCSFTSNAAELSPTDYTVASGIFNVKLGHSVDRWRDYVAETLEAMRTLSTRAFAFNMLTTYSDPDKRRQDLYYADPKEMFDFCTRRFSGRVSLFHDYPLYEFTMIVRV
jgi:SAM-dependent methyltransferase